MGVQKQYMTEQQSTVVQEVALVPEKQQVIRQTKIVTPSIVTESPQKTYQKKKMIFRGYQIIWYILGVIEILLAFRVVLKLLGANPFSGFSSFIYAISGPFALPFAGILETSESSDLILEWSTLIGMVVYTIVAYGIVAIFQLVKPTNPEEVEQAVDNV